VKFVKAWVTKSQYVAPNMLPLPPKRKKVEGSQELPGEFGLGLRGVSRYPVEQGDVGQFGQEILVNPGSPQSQAHLQALLSSAYRGRGQATDRISRGPFGRLGAGMMKFYDKLVGHGTPEDPDLKKVEEWGTKQEMAREIEKDVERRFRELEDLSDPTLTTFQKIFRKFQKPLQQAKILIDAGRRSAKLVDIGRGQEPEGVPASAPTRLDVLQKKK